MHIHSLYYSFMLPGHSIIFPRHNIILPGHCVMLPGLNVMFSAVTFVTLLLAKQQYNAEEILKICEPIICRRSTLRY